MFRIGVPKLLLFVCIATSIGQSQDVVCSGAWQRAEVDDCLLPFAQSEGYAEEPAPVTQMESLTDTDLVITREIVFVRPESDEPLTGPIIPETKRKEGFHWGAAIRQSAKLLAFQQGMMLATDKWARYSIQHGKFLKDYFASVKGGLQQWDDGDPFMDNYIGHPLQGAVTGYIQIQNDPQGRQLVFGNHRAYWKSRWKAMGWIALYSTQFEIGPISESSIENLGSFEYQNCPTCKMTKGAGWVDLVVTPALGVAWLVGEDALDRYFVTRLERRFGPGKWTNLFRCILNPARMGANILRLKAPWYRDNRTPESRPLAQLQ